VRISRLAANFMTVYRNGNGTGVSIDVALALVGLS
jgi:hypothetical protein